MLKDKQQTVVAGRSIEEILKRFDNKIKDPRRTSKGKNVSKIIKEFLKINCPINQAGEKLNFFFKKNKINFCLLYTSPSPRDATLSRMPSSA